jgi:predicted NACHT family NTPase
VDYWKGAASPRGTGSIIQGTAEAIYQHGERVGWSRERTEFLGEAAVELWTRHRPGNDEIVRLNFNREAILARVMQDGAGLDRDDVEPVRTILSLALEQVLERMQPEMELAISQEVLERLEQIRKQTSIQPTGQDYEERYRYALAASLETVQLYGVYDSDDYRYGLTPSFVLLRGRAVASNPHAPSPQSGTLDEVLHSGRRFLIRGEAGFGKTTLLRWLAVQSARKRLDGLLEPWNWRVPFYFQLRDLTPTAPSPEDFPRQFAGLVAGLKPQGWVTQQLVDGRGLLLVDGLDEITEQRRREVRAWLDELLTNFPSTVVIVTSRPAAAANKWLENHEFVDVELQPMTLPEIDAMVEKWFQEYKRPSYSELA